MSTEKEKMLQGEMYNASDPELLNDRTRARQLFRRLNDLDPSANEERSRVLRELIPAQGDNLWVESPFFCDYGFNMRIGNNVFFNMNCTILDVMQVSIGNNVLFGPGVQIYTATHPMDWKTRAAGLENAKPITLGSDIWIGGSVIICPGVSIGDRSVIGAGSVVTRNIPADVFAAGNPCRIIKHL